MFPSPTRSTPLRGLFGSLLLLVAVAAALPALPAEATTARMVPADGSVVSDAVGIVVTVDRDLGEEVAGVDVRLSLDGYSPASGTAPRELDCLEGAGCDGLTDRSDRWGDVVLAGNGGELSTGPICNGRYLLQYRIVRDQPGPWIDHVVTLSDRSLLAPRRLAVDASRDRALLHWEPLRAAPDVRLLLERRRASGATWATVADLDGDTTGFVDRGLAPGRYDYRLTAYRGDGLIDGAPAGPCTDRSPDVTASSPTRRVEIVATTAAPTAEDEGDAGADPSEDPESEPTAGSDPAAGDSPDEPQDDPEGGAGAADPETGGATGSADQPAGDPTRTHVAAPPPPTGRGAQVGAPPIAVPSPEEEYFGEDDPYSEELPFAASEPDEQAASSAPPGGVMEVFPASIRAITRMVPDERRILVPIAAGLLLVCLALHLRRWTRETP